MKKSLISLTLLFVALPLFSGVVFEMQTKDLRSSSKDVTNAKMFIEGKSLKMDIASQNGKSNNEVIFRGDRQEMLIISHQDKSYFIIDEKQMKAISDQINQAMSSMELALANLPEAQQAQMKQMMQGRMPDLGEKREPSELRKTSETDTISGYPCVRYEVWRSGIKEREMWVTGWNEIEGGSSVMEVFEELADFTRSLMDSLPMEGEKSIADPTFEHMKEINGFPVKTLEFDSNGSVVSEATFLGSKSVNLDSADFQPPKKYKHRDMMKQLRK